MPNSFSRTAQLIGSEALDAIRAQRVILFGVGGVGSWCAESLVRSGVEQLTIVDGDVVNESNINRQLLATQSTLGRVKVEVLRERLLDINPAATITALHRFFTKETAAEFHLDAYDYILDCIDSLSNKAYLLLYASTFRAKVFSSMGAALKMDPSRIRVGEYWKVRGCPLGAALRKKMRREGVAPAKEIMCVYSEELLENKEQTAKFNGTIVYITAIFGFTLSSLVLQDVINQQNN